MLGAGAVNRVIYLTTNAMPSKKTEPEGLFCWVRLTVRFQDGRARRIPCHQLKARKM